MPAKIRKIIVQTDEVRVEMGRDVQPPVRKALAMAVIENPCAGRYVENLDELIAIGEELGGLLWFALLACQGQFVATSAPQALTGAAWPRGAVMESEVGSVFA